MSFIQNFFANQVALCKRIDRSVFGSCSIDGNKAFISLAHGRVVARSSVADVGGGKSPFFSPAEVMMRELSVTAIDIDEHELALAPPGSYSKTVVSPIESCVGDSDHDYVLAQSVLEHVRNGREAAAGIASLLRPNGVVITFCPCRRAWFARINRLLPEPVKKSVLFWIFPYKRERQGFPAFYDGCTPDELTENMLSAGVEKIEVQYFFASSYFMFFFPLYLFWRLTTYPFMRLWPERYCETFIFVGKKQS